MHILLDYDGNLPAYVYITDGKTADNKGAYDIPLLANSVIVADRYYNDFSLLNVWDSNSVFFVVRHKDNLQFKTVRENTLPEDRQQHILKNEIIVLTGIITSACKNRVYELSGAKTRPLIKKASFLRVTP